MFLQAYSAFRCRAKRSYRDMAVPIVEAGGEAPDPSELALNKPYMRYVQYAGVDEAMKPNYASKQVQCLTLFNVVCERSVCL